MSLPRVVNRQRTDGESNRRPLDRESDALTTEPPSHTPATVHGCIITSKRLSHFSGVRFSTAVDFAEAASTNYPMYAEVVHRQLQTTTRETALHTHESRKPRLFSRAVEGR